MECCQTHWWSQEGQKGEARHRWLAIPPLPCLTLTYVFPNTPWPNRPYPTLWFLVPRIIFWFGRALIIRFIHLNPLWLGIDWPFCHALTSYFSPSNLDLWALYTTCGMIRLGGRYALLERELLFSRPHGSPYLDLDYCLNPRTMEYSSCPTTLPFCQDGLDWYGLTPYPLFLFVQIYYLWFTFLLCPILFISPSYLLSF
jgi:hypothetical protein